MDLSLRDLLTLALHDIWARVGESDIDNFEANTRSIVRLGTTIRYAATYDEMGVRAGLMEAIFNKIKEENHA